MSNPYTYDSCKGAGGWSGGDCEERIWDTGTECDGVGEMDDE